MKKREAGEDAVPVLLFIAIPIFSFSCEVRKLKYKFNYTQYVLVYIP